MGYQSGLVPPNPQDLQLRILSCYSDGVGTAKLNIFNVSSSRTEQRIARNANSTTADKEVMSCSDATAGVDRIKCVILAVEFLNELSWLLSSLVASQIWAFAAWQLRPTAAGTLLTLVPKLDLDKPRLQ